MIPFSAVIVAVLMMCTVPILNTHSWNDSPSGIDTMNENSETADIKAVLSADETYTLELGSNPTTGYDWYIKSNSGLTVEQEYVPKVTDPGICGAGGTAVFRMTAETPGEYSIVLSYERSFEKDSCIDSKTIELVFE